MRTALHDGWTLRPMAGELPECYESTFTWDGTGERSQLVFDGLDTVATVEVNGSLVAPNDTMARVLRTPTGYRVEVTARTLLRDIALLVDKLDPDAVVDDMLLTLLPGESAVLNVTSTADLADADLLDPAVLRSVNQLVAEVRR